MNHKLLDNPEQQLLCVDLNGRQNGKIVDRKSAHSNPGIKHLAIQVLVFTPKNDLVLHERPMKKVGGGVLDAPTTHVLKGETSEQAALRCLKNEYGILAQKVSVSILSGFSYEKDYGDGSCENEFCLAAFCTFSGKIVPSKEHAGKIETIPAKKVLNALEAKNWELHYPIWFKETVEIVARDLKGKKFF